MCIRDRDGAGAQATTGAGSGGSAPCAAPFPNLPTPRAFSGAAQGADGRLYVAGGTADNHPFSAVVEVYNRCGNAWSEVSSLSYGGGLELVALPDGRLLSYRDVE